ncbi:hypothetical protein GCM10027513_16680 [Giesbergeria giesbergeri]
MHLRGWRQRLVWWLLWGMVFAAIAPAISKGLAANASTVVEVCNSQGIQRITVNLGSTNSPETHVATDVHCGYCLLQHHCPTLPSQPPQWGLLTVARHVLRLDPDRTTALGHFARSAHRVRAPPAFS